MGENQEARTGKGATEPQKEGFGPLKLPLPGDTGVGRREEGGHFYLVTKESHTIVLFSALGRGWAPIFTRGTEVAVATTHLGPGIQMCCIQKP